MSPVSASMYGVVSCYIRLQLSDISPLSHSFSLFPRLNEPRRHEIVHRPSPAFSLVVSLSSSRPAWTDNDLYCRAVAAERRRWDDEFFDASPIAEEAICPAAMGRR